MRIPCPNCGASVSVDEDLQSSRCSNCQQWLHAVECTICSHTYVSRGARTERCPRCAHAVRFASARLRTFVEARDATGTVHVAERPAPVRMTGVDFVDTRAAPRFLVGLFSLLTWLTIVCGLISVMIVDSHLGQFSNSGGVMFGATVGILASTVVSAALFAFCSHSLALLVELAERPSPAEGETAGAEGLSAREPGT